MCFDPLKAIGAEAILADLIAFPADRRPGLDVLDVACLVLFADVLRWS